MITISLCMIVRNEENGLGRCLESVRDIADEIVIVDTGSTDRTKEIAAEYGAVIYDFEWIDDFGAARNEAFSKATKEYILWLDADDVIEEADQKLFKELKETLSTAYHSVNMPYNLGVDSEGRVTSSLRRNRLVRRDCNFQWIGPVHEYLAAGGPRWRAIYVSRTKKIKNTLTATCVFTADARPGEKTSHRATSTILPTSCVITHFMKKRSIITASFWRRVKAGSRTITRRA